MFSIMDRYLYLPHSWCTLTIQRSRRTCRQRIPCNRPPRHSLLSDDICQGHNWCTLTIRRSRRIYRPSSLSMLLRRRLTTCLHHTTRSRSPPRWQCTCRPHRPRTLSPTTVMRRTSRPRTSRSPPPRRSPCACLRTVENQRQGVSAMACIESCNIGVVVRRSVS